MHFTFTIIVTSIIAFSSGLIPDYIFICQANDPNITACINNSINHLRPRLKSGIPDLDVPPLEPLPVDEIKLQTGSAGAVINCNITNLQVWGPASFVVTELKPNVRKNKFNFKVWLPRLYFKGVYALDMKILLINVRGSGEIEGNFTDYRSEIWMKGRKIMKGSEEYLKFDNIRLRLNIGKTNINLKNLFEDDLILRDLFNRILNDNSEIFINEIKPALEQSLANKFTDIANNITLKFTYNELFP